LISLKKYLDGVEAHREQNIPTGRIKGDGPDVLSRLREAYRSALAAMGRCGLDVCPATGDELQASLGTISDSLATGLCVPSLVAADQTVQAHLREWGRSTARHYQKTAGEVKDILIMMAQTADSLGARDQRCAQQINDVTSKLRNIANLEDLTVIRGSIEKSASELKSSIERMTAEGKAVLESLQATVTVYQAKLEEAEQLASYDSLTRLRSRLWVERQIEQRIEGAQFFCAAIIDIDGFKQVNDDYGHLTGDALLKEFATELRSACRSTDIIGRWGGDEFMVLLDCELPEAQAQIERLSKWVCGNYTLNCCKGPRKLRIDASIGLAQHAPPEAMKELFNRADVEMYRQKVKGRTPPSRDQAGVR
jgi:diguanylate cyclase (GGDEF)-like protein